MRSICCIAMLVMCSYLNAVSITIWVHGTYPVLSLLRKPWLPTRKMVYVEEGLSLAKDLPQNYYFAKLAQDLNTHDPQAYPIDHFYTYGWYSSHMRPGHRIHEGKLLYQRLQVLLEEYSKKYDKVLVRCIGFSHGGNVILNMLSHMPFANLNVDMEVVLLGTPIQESTRSFINSPCITKAYSFYSQGDWIQKIDAQKFHHNCPKGAPFWSQRQFLPQDNICQICLKINGKKIGHSKYRSIVGFLPKMIQQVDALLEDALDIKCLNLNYLTKRNHIKKTKKGYDCGAKFN